MLDVVSLLGPIAYLFFTSVGVALFFSWLAAIDDLTTTTNSDEDGLQATRTWRLTVDQLTGEDDNDNDDRAVADRARLVKSTQSSGQLRRRRRRRRLMSVKYRDVDSWTPKTTTEMSEDSDETSEKTDAARSSNLQSKQPKKLQTRFLTVSSSGKADRKIVDPVLELLTSRFRRDGLRGGVASSSAPAAALVTWFVAMAKNYPQYKRRQLSPAAENHDTYRWIFTVDDQETYKDNKEERDNVDHVSEDRRRLERRRRRDYLITLDVTDVQSAKADIATVEQQEEPASTPNINKDFDLDGAQFDYEEAPDDISDVEDSDLMAELETYFNECKQTKKAGKDEDSLELTDHSGTDVAATSSE